MSATFEPYFTLHELQAHLPFALKVLRAKVKRGEFSPAGPDGLPDLSNCLQDGILLVPLSGLLHYRETHKLSLPAIVSDRIRRRPMPRRPAAATPPATVARSPGEAIRKLRGRMPANVDAAAVADENGQTE